MKFSELIKIEKKSESQTKLFPKNIKDLNEFSFLENYFFLDNYRLLKLV